MQSILPIFLFSQCFLCIAQENFPYPEVVQTPSRIYSESFIYTIKSKIPPGIGMEENSDLIVSFMENQTSQYHLLKTLHFLTALHGYLYNKSSSTYITDDSLFFLQSVLLVYACICVPIPQYFHCYSFIMLIYTSVNSSLQILLYSYS